MGLPPVSSAFVSAGGLPTRITQPQFGPLTRAASVQAKAAREVADLRTELLVLQNALIEIDATNQHPQLSHNGTAIAGAREVATRLTQMNATLIALENALQEAIVTIESLRRERGQLQSLYVIAEHLNSTMALDELLTYILTDSLMLVEADEVAIFLADEQQALFFERGLRIGGLTLLEDQFQYDRPAVQKLWQAQFHTENTRILQDTTNTAMTAILKTQDEAIGLMYVKRRLPQGAYTPEMLDLFAAFCNEAAIAIQNARLFALQQLQTQEIAAMKTYTESILTSISSGVMALDNSGRITKMNNALERILNIGSDLYLEHHYTEVLGLIGDTELLRKVQATLPLPAVDESLLLEVLLVGHPDRNNGLSKLNIGWSALLDAKQQRLGSVIVVEDLTDLGKAQQEAEILGRYVAKDVINLVTHNPSAAELGGETRDITTLFADIRGYTSLGEDMSPKALVALLNEYLSLLTEAIRATDGTVTMFQGDGVMAIFNAPYDQKDHALRAVRGAWTTLLAIERHNQQTGCQPIHVGIGINTGPALVGNIGAVGHLQHYTAIGDTVNIAKRLEQTASANQILLSETTYTAVAPMIRASSVGEVKVKGKSNSIRVWEMTGWGE